MNKLTILLLLATFANGGCSYMTSRGRAQASYARYLRHCSTARARTQPKSISYPSLPPAQLVSDPQIAAGAGPESVTDSNDSQN